eukprot:COSAG02_NODE_1718_length_11207_cov_2.888999_4_plen_88_part_00
MLLVAMTGCGVRLMLVLTVLNVCANKWPFSLVDKRQMALAIPSDLRGQDEQKRRITVTIKNNLIVGTTRVQYAIAYIIAEVPVPIPA